MIILKFRYGNQPIKELEIAEYSTDIFEIVKELFNFDEKNLFELLAGYPLKCLDDSCHTAAELKLQNGETITVRVKSESNGTVLKGQVKTSRRRTRLKNSNSIPDEESKKSLEDYITMAFQGGSTEHGHKMLRRAARTAVKKAYDIETAIDRYQAACAGTFCIEENLKDRTNGKVKYHPRNARPETRATDHNLRILNTDELKVTLQCILLEQDAERKSEAQKSLEPESLALVSPELFWSFVKYWRNSLPAETDMKVVYAHLLPEFDWSKLGVRKRTLSAKAKANVKAAEVAIENAKERKERKERPIKQIKTEKKANKNLEKMLAETAMAVVRENRRLSRNLKGKITSSFELAKYESEDFLSFLQTHDKSIDADQASAYRDQFRMQASIDLVHQIVPTEYWEQMKDACMIENVQDLTRLRIPGRDIQCAKELGVDLSLVKSWQSSAQGFMNQHPWLREYRAKYG